MQPKFLWAITNNSIGHNYIGHNYFASATEFFAGSATETQMQPKSRAHVPSHFSRDICSIFMSIIVEIV